jgi:hypothetical protein
MSTSNQLVQKLWNYCNILSPAHGFRLRRGFGGQIGATCRDDGLSFRLRQSILQRAFAGKL